jgi:hypothetical protein
VLVTRRERGGTSESGYRQQLLMQSFIARSPIRHPTRRVLPAPEVINRVCLHAKM